MKQQLIKMAIDSGFILSDDTGIKIRGESGHIFDITDNMETFASLVLCMQSADNVTEESIQIEKQNKAARIIVDAAKNLIKVKGRHHSEIAMNKLIEAVNNHG